MKSKDLIDELLAAGGSVAKLRLSTNVPNSRYNYAASA